MEEGPEGRWREVGTGDASSGRSRPRLFLLASRAGTQTCPPSLSISGSQALRLPARCAYSLLRVPGMSQWCPSQLHDSTALASLPPLGGGRGLLGVGGGGGVDLGRIPD